MSYFVYILRTSSNTLYIGQTNNLEKRIKEHENKSSKSAKYIRYFPSSELVYHESYPTRSEAMQRESQLKKLSKARKEDIIAGDSELKKKLEKAGKVYSPYNINVYNELFYRYGERKLINELPNLFTKLDLFNVALHKKITTELSLKEIKVMELASGKKMGKWETFIKINKKHKWKVLLTDFDKTLLPLRARGSSPNHKVLGTRGLNRRQKTKIINTTDNFIFSTEIYSLFDNFPKLNSDEKHDCLLSTYTFDNLWLEDDLHLTKINNVWYKNLYGLDLSKTEESIKDIRQVKKLDRQFFKNLKIKTKKAKINIFSLKHGAHIDKYYKNYKSVSVNYPGGLIATVINSYNNQLKKKGIFITADIATEDVGRKTKGFKSVNETIKIKIENYALAKYILEKLDFYIELKNLYEFIKEAGIVTPVKIHDHFVLVVRLRG